MRFISISLFWWSLNIKIKGTNQWECSISSSIWSWFMVQNVTLYNKLDTTSIYLHFFNVFVWLTYHSLLVMYLCIGNEMEIFVILKILHQCLKEWLKFNVEFCLLRWWAIVNEYWDLSQNFECLEKRHFAFAKHILEVIKSNSLLHKNSSILCK